MFSYSNTLAASRQLDLSLVQLLRLSQKTLHKKGFFCTKLTEEQFNENTVFKFLLYIATFSFENDTQKHDFLCNFLKTVSNFGSFVKFGRLNIKTSSRALNNFKNDMKKPL